MMARLQYIPAAFILMVWIAPRAITSMVATALGLAAGICVLAAAVSLAFVPPDD